MTRLILTTSDSGGGSLKVAAVADVVVFFSIELVWGPLPSDVQFANMLGARSAPRGSKWSHWLDIVSPKRRQAIGASGLTLNEFCAECEKVELWVDPEPNAQLMLIWLLSCFRGHQAASKLSLVQANVALGSKAPEDVARWVPPAVPITDDHLDVASLAWQAYRAPTPQPWFDLLAKDMSPLPWLRRAVLALLEELPWRTTGLGATEMRFLELIDEAWMRPYLVERGGVRPFDLFPVHNTRNERRAFGFWATGELLDGLAHCPAPAISGLKEGPFKLDLLDDRKRRQLYHQSRLFLTPLGEAILAGREDFSRHNPIHRWWGGTELTNDRLWHWDPAKGALIAP